MNVVSNSLLYLPVCCDCVSALCDGSCMFTNKKNCIIDILMNYYLYKTKNS